jgi:hypothetical protein
MTDNYTPAQRFQLAAERIEIERKKLRGMSTTMRIRGESSVSIMQEVIDIVCKAFGVTEEEVRGPNRIKRIAHARHAYCYLCNKLDPMITLKEVGDTISRDHSTVINSIKKTGDLRLTDYHFTASFNLCLDAIAESNSKYVQRLSTEQATQLGENELHKSVHALTVVHEFMLAYSAYELRMGDGYPSPDELLEDLKALRLKAIKLGF